MYDGASQKLPDGTQPLLSDEASALEEDFETFGMKLTPLKETVSELISVLAHAGSEQDSIAESSYDNALQLIFPNETLPKILNRNDCTLHLVDAVLNKLSQSSPAIKKRLLETAIACVAADGQVTLAEAELVRAIAASLDCPLPPLNPGPIPTS